jgi:hypothetical protein
LRSCWASWTALVEALARRPDRPPRGERAYQELYQVLVQECAAHAEQADEGTRPFFHQLEELVQPWMSLAALTRTEPALLQDLARRARRAGQVLGVPSTWGWGPCLLGAILLAAGALGWLLVESPGWVRSVAGPVREVGARLPPIPLYSFGVLLLAGLATWLLLRRRT